MAYLKDTKCIKCGGRITVNTFSENGKVYVDYGECEDCMKVEILPQDEYKDFRPHIMM